MSTELSIANAGVTLSGGWRVLIEGHSLRGDSAHARMLDGLRAASEVQLVFEAEGMPADRIVTLSCGSERREIIPEGATRSAEISILPGGIASPDLACGWSDREAFVAPASPESGATTGSPSEP